MPSFSISLPEHTGKTLTGQVVDPVTDIPFNPTPVALVESNGVFTGTVTEELPSYIANVVVREAGIVIAVVSDRLSPAPALHASEHMPDGSSGQVLYHNGADFVAVNNEVITDLAKSDIQGYYGLLTNFYFVGGVPTVTEIDTESVDQWVDVNFDVDAQGTFDYRPDPMKLARPVGHSGAGTQADPIEFSLEGLTLSSSANFRASMTFEPDVDEAQLETRLIFTRHSGTIPDTQFPIADVSLIMNNGADIEYDAEPMLSFFVGDTIDTNGPGDAGSCRFQIRSSVEGTLRMRALTWYIQS